MQAGVGAAAGGGTGEADETGLCLPNRRFLRAAFPRPPPALRHELRVHEDAAGERRRRLPAAAPLGGHRQQHTEHRPGERQHARGRRRRRPRQAGGGGRTRAALRADAAALATRN